MMHIMWCNVMLNHPDVQLCSARLTQSFWPPPCLLAFFLLFRRILAPIVEKNFWGAPPSRPPVFFLTIPKSSFSKSLKFIQNHGQSRRSPCRQPWKSVKIWVVLTNTCLVPKGYGDLFSSSSFRSSLSLFQRSLSLVQSLFFAHSIFSFLELLHLLRS